MNSMYLFTGASICILVASINGIFKLDFSSSPFIAAAIVLTTIGWSVKP